jgi:predicted nucleic acid-binding protein
MNLNQNCLLDTNIVFDIALQRARFTNLSKILESCQNLYISTNTFANSFYILPKTGLAKDLIAGLLLNYKILPFSELHCFSASNRAKKSEDVEDCMELELAKEHKLALITADKEFVNKYNYPRFILVE